MLWLWDWLRLHDLLKSKPVLSEYAKTVLIYRVTGNKLLLRFAPAVSIPHGLSFGYEDRIEYPLRTFEVMGIAALIGIDQFTQAKATGYPVYRAGAENAARVLTQLIQNNPPAFCPRFDGHVVDITLALLLLSSMGWPETGTWLDQMIDHIMYAYRRLGRYFPISTDSYDDLVAMELDPASVSKEKLMELSTLLLLLAEWCAILDLADTYASLRKGWMEILPKPDLQLWYPDETTESYLYKGFAASDSGYTASQELPETLEDLRKEIAERHSEAITPKSFSCVASGVPVLALMASRHFRTPVIPLFWENAFATVEATADASLGTEPSSPTVGFE